MKECIVLRIEFPRICALFFEEVLQVIIKELIGWDEKNEAPREGYEGLFGVPFTMSNEEQARCTLHVHILLWIKNLNELWEKLLSAATTLHEKANVQKLLIKIFDKIASCKLVDFSGKQSLKVQQCFNHECTHHTGHRRYPEVVEDQELRNLHHRVYYSHLLLQHCMRRQMYKNC